LGVSLFQLLTGHLPFTADSMTGLMQQIAEAPHPPLRAYRPDLPACVETIIDQTAAQRYGTKTDGNATAASTEVLVELLASLSEGHLEVPIARTYPLAEVRAAFRELEHRHTLGKIVLKP